MFSSDEVQQLIERRAKLCFYDAQDVFEYDTPLPDATDVGVMDALLASGVVSDIREFLSRSSGIDTMIHNYVPCDYLRISRDRVLFALGRNRNVTLPEEGSEVGDDTPLVSSTLRTHGAFKDSRASTSCFTFFTRCFTSCFSGGRHEHRDRLIQR